MGRFKELGFDYLYYPEFIDFFENDSTNEFEQYYLPIELNEFERATQNSEPINESLVAS